MNRKRKRKMARREKNKKDGFTVRTFVTIMTCFIYLSCCQLYCQYDMLAHFFFRKMSKIRDLYIPSLAIFSVQQMILQNVGVILSFYSLFNILQM